MDFSDARKLFYSGSIVKVNATSIFNCVAFILTKQGVVFGLELSLRFLWGGGCGQNLGLIMQQNQDDVYTQSGSARLKIT